MTPAREVVDTRLRVLPHSEPGHCMSRYRVQLMGTHAVFGPDGERIDFPSGKPFALFCYLLLRPEPCTREALGRLFWPASSRDRRQQSVRQALWLIRRLLDEDVLDGEDPVGPAEGVIAADVAELEAAFVAADGERVDALWGGGLLSQFVLSGLSEWEAWLDEERSRLERQAGAVLHVAALGAAGGGVTDRAVRWLGRAIAIEPYRLDHRLGLVDLLVDHGRVAEAEQALVAARQALPEPEFAGELETRAARLAELRRGATDEPGVLLSQPEFVGRARELSQLAASWRAARGGRTRVALLTGEAGAGKTRLAQELAALAERDGGRVVVVRATAPEQELKWSGVATLVRRLLVLPGAGGISAASEQVLHRLVPSLARRPAAATSPQLPEAAPLADAVADLIGAVSFETPLLLLLDDAQWLDPSSWALLGRQIVQLETDPVQWVLTARAGETSPAMSRSLARLDRQDGALVLPVVNFTAGEVAEFLAYNAGLGAAGRSDGLVAKLHRTTRGNPLFLVECLKSFRDAGALVWADGRWMLELARVPESLPLPSNVEALLAQRLSDLTPAARRLAQSLAGRGTYVQYDELSAVTDLRPAQIAAGLTELVRRGLVVQGGDGYALAHDRLADALRETGRKRHRGVRRRGLIAAGVAVVLVVSALGFFWNRIPAAPLYGGGALYGLAADTLVEWRPPRRPGGAWSVRATPGAALWFAYERHDVGFDDLSPDGRHVLYSRDDPASPEYAPRLHIVDRDGGNTRLLLDRPVAMGHARFSPDGSLIAVVARGAVDSLLVVKREGRVIQAHELTRGGPLEWCGAAQIVAVVAEREADHLVRIPLGGEPIVVRDDVLASAGVACSPDAEWALVTVIEDGLPAPSLVGIHTGEREALPFAPPRGARWLPDGRVVGNGPGSAGLIAEHAGWLRDSVLVPVGGPTDPALLLHDEFESLDRGRWAPFGGQVPELDGIRLRRGFGSALGVTAELEVRHLVTGRQGQTFVFRLCGVRGSLTEAQLDALPDRFAWSAQARFAYPAIDLDRQDPSEVLFGFDAAAQTIRLEDELPTDGWTHVALQIQPDGYASLAVNRRRVAVSRLRLPDHAAVEWRVCISGPARDAESMVRHLRVWRGVRY